MPDDTFTAPPVLLVATTETDWEVLQPAAETLDQFAVRWRRAENGWDLSRDVDTAMPGWRAVIVASPDAALPALYAGAAGQPTIRVPVEGNGRAGLDLLRDEVGQLPAGPDGGVFATMAIGTAGAKNAALFLVAAFAQTDGELRSKWQAFRERQTAAVLEGPAPDMEGEG